MSKESEMGVSDDGASAEASPVSPKDASSTGSSETRELDWETRYKYLFADLENFRRRSERDKESASQQTRAGIIRQLLPIYEAFHYARDAVGRLAADDSVRQGLELLYREWRTFLKHEGVEPVARVGEQFQSEVHEAVGEAPVTNSHPPGSVVEVVQQGYRFFGGLLRPAKVVVARGDVPSARSEPVEPESTTDVESNVDT